MITVLLVFPRMFEQILILTGQKWTKSPNKDVRKLQRLLHWSGWNENWLLQVRGHGPGKVGGEAYVALHRSGTTEDEGEM